MIPTNEEAFDMLAVYFECMRNSTIAARVYTAQYPQRRRYSRGVFDRLANRLRTTGNIHLPVYSRYRRGRTEENVTNVLAYVNFNPKLSIREISRDLGICRSTVHNILRKHK